MPRFIVIDPGTTPLQREELLMSARVPDVDRPSAGRSQTIRFSAPGNRVGFGVTEWLGLLLS